MNRSVSLRILVPLALVLAGVIAFGATYIVQLQWKAARLSYDVGRLERQLARVESAGRAEATDKVPVPTGPRTLTDDQRRAMLDALAAETGEQRGVWFSRARNNAEAEAYQRALQAVFEEAGWQVRGSTTANFAMKPGVFFLMADDDPPGYVLTALDAMNAAGIAVTAGTGYRAFNDQKKAEDPNWRGFDMAPDQGYVVAIGRKPS